MLDWLADFTILNDLRHNVSPRHKRGEGYLSNRVQRYFGNEQRKTHRGRLFFFFQSITP